LKKEMGTVRGHTGVCLLAIAGLLSPAFCQGPTADTKLADKQDIYAAVIRHQMEEWVKSGEKNEAEAKTEEDKSVAQRLNFEIFFVSVEGKDPSDDFINRLSDIPRTIEKASNEEPGKGRIRLSTKQLIAQGLSSA
jgi:hypothetical protein